MHNTQSEDTDQIEASASQPSLKPVQFNKCIAGNFLSNLQPLKRESCHRKIFSDVEKILGRALPFGHKRLARDLYRPEEARMAAEAGRFLSSFESNMDGVILDHLTNKEPANIPKKPIVEYKAAEPRLSHNNRNSFALEEQVIVFSDIENNKCSIENLQEGNSVQNNQPIDEMPQSNIEENTQTEHLPECSEGFVVLPVCDTENYFCLSADNQIMPTFDVEEQKMTTKVQANQCKLNTEICDPCMTDTKAIENGQITELFANVGSVNATLKPFSHLSEVLTAGTSCDKGDNIKRIVGNLKIPEANICEIICKIITEKGQVNSPNQINAENCLKNNEPKRDTQGVNYIAEQTEDFKSEKNISLNNIDAFNPCIDQTLNHSDKEIDSLPSSYSSLKQNLAIAYDNWRKIPSRKKCGESSYSEEQRFYQEILQKVKANRENKEFSKNAEQMTSGQTPNVYTKQNEGIADGFDSFVYNDENQPILSPTSHCEEEIIRIDHGVAGSMEELQEAVECSGSEEVALQNPQFCHQPGQIVPALAQPEKPDGNADQEACNTSNRSLGTVERHKESNGEPAETVSKTVRA